MAGIYIHIPFCKQACVYCNFHFSTSMQLKNDFVNALLKEINIRKDYLENENIETIYLGGGSPSLLSPNELELILDQLHKNFRICQPAEITLEANPDDISYEKIVAWQSFGFNRLSLGIQSFFDEDLKWMNRAHTTEQSINSIRLAKEAGLSNLSIDLIYGMPGLNDEKWKLNIEKAIAFDIPHLSCYALTVEPKTSLHHLIQENKSPGLNAESQARQFLLLMDWLEEGDYEHYEISNFARSGKRSRHNSSYWQQKKYIGFGPSAHSYDQRSRQWNIANNALYIDSLKKGMPSYEIETLSPVQRLNEYIMTGLRTLEGICLQFIKDEFGESAANLLNKDAARYEKKGLTVIREGTIRLTREGKLWADGIAAGLFFEKL